MNAKFSYLIFAAILAIALQLCTAESKAQIPPCPSKLAFQVFNLYAYETVNCNCVNCPGPSSSCVSSESTEIQYFTQLLNANLLGCNPPATCAQCKVDPIGIGGGGRIKALVTGNTALTPSNGTTFSAAKYISVTLGSGEVRHYICFTAKTKYNNVLLPPTTQRLQASIAIELDQLPAGQTGDPGRIDTSVSGAYSVIYDKLAGGNAFALVDKLRKAQNGLAKPNLFDELPPPAPINPYPIRTNYFGAVYPQGIPCTPCYCLPQ